VQLVWRQEQLQQLVPQQVQQPQVQQQLLWLALFHNPLMPKPQAMLKQVISVEFS
jgi:hypothetical protein